MDKSDYIQRAKDRNLLGKKVTVTFTGPFSHEQVVTLRGMHQEDNDGRLYAVVGTMPEEPLCCGLVHVSRIKEIMADEFTEDKGAWGDRSGRMWELVSTHLEGVERAVRGGKEMVAFRIAGDAVSCLFDAIRFSTDGE